MPKSPSSKSSSPKSSSPKSSGSTPSLLLEPNHSLPLVRVQVTLRAGAACDAAPHAACGLGNGKTLDGLANFATELQRRGAGGRNRAALDEAIDSLGASVHVLCWHDQILFEAMALKENIDAACAILSDVLLRPDFPKGESDKLQRELAASMDDLRDDDGGLMQRFFARAMYGSHPYGVPIGGTAESIPLYNAKLAQSWVSHYLTRENVLFGAAGDLKEPEAKALFARHFGDVPEGPRRDPEFTGPPKKQRGLRLVLVDKPERTQSQILIGQMAPHWSDPNWLPLLVATTAFGGMFTARLMDEVRVKRGLSYGASARLGSGRGQRTLCAHVFPAADKTAETLDLVLSLYRDWAEKGLRKEEAVFAKSYLQKSHAFTIQTADDRLNLKTRLALCDMPLDYATSFPERIAAIDEKMIKKAMEEALSPDDLLITIVGTASTLLPHLKKLPVLKKAAIEVVPYDSY